MTDLADVAPGQAQQRGVPVGDVEQSLGDPPPALQQGAVDEGHAPHPALPVGPLQRTNGEPVRHQYHFTG